MYSGEREETCVKCGCIWQRKWQKGQWLIFVASGWCENRAN